MRSLLQQCVSAVVLVDSGALKLHGNTTVADPLQVALGESCRTKILQEVMTAAVLPQHVPPPYSNFFDANDVVRHGARYALQCAQDRYSADVAGASGAMSGSRTGPWGWFASKFMSPKESQPVDIAPLNEDAVMGLCQYHAAMLLRAPQHVEQLQKLPLLRQMVQSSGSRMLEAMRTDLPAGAFAGTRKRACLCGVPARVSGA